MSGGLLIFALLVATALWVFLRGPGRRLLLGGMPGARSRKDRLAQSSDRTLSIGGPFSRTEFGGFGGARRRAD